jgi:hypothetical protein
MMHLPIMLMLRTTLFISITEVEEREFPLELKEEITKYSIIPFITPEEDLSHVSTPLCLLQTMKTLIITNATLPTQILQFGTPVKSVISFCSSAILFFSCEVL